MNWEQYESARATLGWTHRHTAHVIGVSLRTVHRQPMPKAAARLLRLLVLTKLTASDRKFDAVLAELEKQ